MSAVMGSATMAFIAPATGLPGIPSVLAPLRMGPGPCSTQVVAPNAAVALEKPTSAAKIRMIDFRLNMKVPLIFIRPGNRAQLFAQVLCQNLTDRENYPK